jgi:hypothetical protein
MPVLAFSAIDVLVGLGLAVAGFIVVALVCVAVLAVLQVVLPSTDSGADDVDRLHPPPAADPDPAADELDTEANA